ncbi:MAG: hypothetical protein LCH30_01115 [Proteobacteria bacterium]|nr:hypothetical protein [Pseudomonadota bacterium]
MNEEMINFATVSEHGEMTIEALSPSELASRTNQNFVWTNEVLIQQEEALSCYILKLQPPTVDSPLDHSQLKKVMVNWFGRNVVGKVVILYGQQFYFAELTSTDIRTTVIIESEENSNFLQSLTQSFEKLKANTYKLADKKTLKIITSLLGILDIDLISRNTIHNNLQEKLQQAKEMQKKLAIIKINDLVGYGVIAVEDIPANTIVSLYAGILSNQSFMNKYDTYILGTHNFMISAKTHRNFSGFITHAFERKSQVIPHYLNKIYLDDFHPIKEDKTHWQANLVSSNLSSEMLIANNKLYFFLKSQEAIKKGNLIAWDYGLKYWANAKIAPALLTLKGEVVAPDTYTCSNEDYIKAFTLVDEEKEENFKLVKSRPFLFLITILALLVLLEILS